MNKLMKRTGCAKSMPAGLAIGTGFAMGITLLGCLLSAKLVDMEVIGETKIGYAIMIVLLTASFTSGVIAHKNIKRRKALVCVCSGVAYLVLLLFVTALFFGAQYESVWETMAVISAGTVLALLHKKRGNKEIGKKKIKIPNC